MKKSIAHKVITVSGKPSPCDCTDGIVCAYCVQANLILWESKEEKEIPTENIIDRISRNGVRKTARSLAVEHSTILRWIKKRRIPNKYREKLYSEVSSSGA